MKRPVRRVVIADVGVSIVKVKPAGNGAMSLADVRDLATAAALSPQSTSRTVWIRRTQLPDLEAYAEMHGIVVQRIGRAS